MKGEGNIDRSFESVTRYLSGGMTDPEQHKMEKGMLQDVLLNDAVEGWQEIGTERRLPLMQEAWAAYSAKQKAKKNTKNRWFWYPAAAAALLIFSAGFYVFLTRPEPPKHLAHENNTAAELNRPDDALALDDALVLLEEQSTLQAKEHSPKNAGNVPVGKQADVQISADSYVSETEAPQFVKRKGNVQKATRELRQKKQLEVSELSAKIMQADEEEIEQLEVFVPKTMEVAALPNESLSDKTPPESNLQQQDAAANRAEEAYDALAHTDTPAALEQTRQKAFAYYRQKRFKKALPLLDALWHKSPTDPTLLYLLAVSCLETGEADRAVRKISVLKSNAFEKVNLKKVSTLIEKKAYSEALEILNYYVLKDDTLIFVER